MEKQNPAVRPKKHRPVETGDASHVPHPRSFGESPPKKEEERKDHFAEQAQGWEVQWQEFLERVRSQEVLEEAALWQEAKALLASLEEKAETPRSPQKEGAKEPTAEQTLSILPLELQSWLGECGPQTCSEAAALARAFSSRQQESCRRRKQVEGGSSSSAVQKNPSGLRQEKDEELSVLGHVPVSENEGDPHWMLLERAEGKTLCGWQERRGQERKGGHHRKGEHLKKTRDFVDKTEQERQDKKDETPYDWESRRGKERKEGHQREGGSREERMDKSVPSQRGALQEQDKPIEEREKSPGTPRSIDAEGEQNKASLLAESFTQLSMSESGTVGTEDEPRTSSEPRTFAQHDQLSVHQRTHTGEKRHKCPDCSRSFAYRSHYLRHERTHTGEKPYKCSHCSRRFALQSDCRRHEITHTGEKPFKCSHCSRRFARISDCRTHERTHTEEKPHKCSHCSRSFALLSYCRKHERTHTGEKPHKCSHCSRRFALRSDCRTHERTHTGEKPYKCSHCSRRFAQPSHCRTHQRIHTREKLNKCSECGKSFREGKTLHTSERPYKCSKCERTFSLHQRRHTEQAESVPHHSNSLGELQRHSVVYWRPWPNPLECNPLAARQTSAPLGTERVPVPQLCSQVVTAHEPAQLSQLLHTHTACARTVTAVSQQPPALSPCQRHTDREETHRHTFRFSLSPTRTPEVHAHGQSFLLSLPGHQNTNAPCTARSLTLLPLSSSFSPQLLPSLSPLIPAPHRSPAIWRPFQETQLAVPQRASVTVPCSSSSLSLSRGMDKVVGEEEEEEKTGIDAD